MCAFPGFSAHSPPWLAATGCQHAAICDVAWHAFVARVAVFASRRYNFSADETPWTTVICAHFGIREASEELIGEVPPISLTTLCSGSDAPVEAIRQFLPPALIDHRCSCDCDDASESWVLSNFDPCCFHKDVRDLLQSEVKCSLAGSHPTHGNQDAPICESKLRDNDFWVLGAPCGGHSPSSKHRYNPGKGGFQNEKSAVYFECMDALEKYEPKAAIVETVDGAKKGSQTQMASIVIFERKLQRSKKFWWVRVECNSRWAGLPQLRKRIYWLLLNKAAGSMAQLQASKQQLLAFFEATELPAKDVSQLALPAEHPLVLKGMQENRPTNAKYKSLHRGMMVSTMRKHVALRKHLGVVGMNHPAGRPVSDTMAPEVFDSMCHRERDVVDIAELVQHLTDEQWGKATAKPTIVKNQAKFTRGLRVGSARYRADVSQSLERWPWSKHMRTVQSTSKVWDTHLRRYYTAADQFKFFGWRIRVIDMSAVKEQDARRLVGSSMEVPLVQAFMCAMMKYVRPGLLKPDHR